MQKLIMVKIPMNEIIMAQNTNGWNIYGKLNMVKLEMVKIIMSK